MNKQIKKFLRWSKSVNQDEKSHIHDFIRKYRKKFYSNNPLDNVWIFLDNENRFVGVEKFSNNVYWNKKGIKPLVIRAYPKGTEYEIIINDVIHSLRVERTGIKTIPKIPIYLYYNP